MDLLWRLPDLCPDLLGERSGISVFTDPMWLVAMFVLAPLLTVMAVNVGVIVSSRTSDPRAAEQWDRWSSCR